MWMSLRHDMKTITLPLAFSFLVTCLGVVHVEAATYYVAANGTNPVPPYASWSTAATNIQDAVNFAQPGDMVLVTNGLYQYRNFPQIPSFRVGIYGTTVQSVNGPALTTIMGYQVPGMTNGPGAIACVWLNGGAVLSGFTLTNGATLRSGWLEGGGVYCASTNCIITNCIIAGNSATSYGGGAYSGIVINCVFSGNTSYIGAGAADNTLINCLLVGNQSINSGGGADESTLINCTIENNVAPTGSGVDGCVVNNCLLAGNGNAKSGSAASFSKLYNCTISGNTASGLGAAQGCTLVNCIIYGNTNGEYADCYQCLLTNCCTTLGEGNSTLPNNSISNAPAFVDPTHGNYRLQIGSPGIDAGNDLYVTNATDLDGNLRIVNGMVDMGCYENQNTNEVLYVSVSSTNPVAPYTNWLTAATNIQDSAAMAQAGDIVVVNNGLYKYGGAMVYGSSNRVALTNAITLLGIYGPQATAIVGSPNGGVSTRCAYVSSNAILSGFSLVDGAASTSGNAITNDSGGGAWCEIGGVISNCIFGGTNFPYANGASPSDGCSAAIAGGGDYGGTIYNSIFANNTATSGGAAGEANLINCLITNNTSRGSKAFAGIDLCTASNCMIVDNNGTGAEQSTLYDCMIVSNSPGAQLSALYNCTVAGNQNGGTVQCTNYGCVLAGNTNTYDGGGANGGVLYNCTLSNNASGLYGGGAYQSSLYNCVVANNWVIGPNGSGGGVYEGTLYDCTVISNTASINGGGTYQSTLYGCQLVDNSSETGGGGGAFGGVLNNCLLTGNTALGNGGGAAYGNLYNCTVFGNVADNGGGVYQCSAYNSIVIDNLTPYPAMDGTNYAGIPGSNLIYCDTTPMPTNGWGNITNDPAFVDAAAGDYELESDSPCINAGDNYYVSTTNDLDGNPRISGGIVDMGAYEYQNPASILSYAWAQQYGLPTDGSADYTDLDDIGMPNWEKAVAGLDPTNSTSVLAMSAPMANMSGITVTWQSVPTVAYDVQRSSDLTQPFVTIQNNLAGQAGTTSFTDTTATNAGPYFYRVGVQ
jgi:hypothetical protein